MRIDADRLKTILEKLDEVSTVLSDLTTAIAGPDLTVQEWATTPIGRALRRLSDAVEMLEGQDQEGEE